MSVQFSIIVPVFNCIEYLPACIDSILAQSEKSFELILIDDGSTDGSSDLCDQLLERDPRIKVYHKENGGASSARNYGLAQSCGEYTLFIDGDDTIDSDLLSVVSAQCAAYKNDLVVFGMAFDFYQNSDFKERTNILSVSHKGVVKKEELLASYDSYFRDNALSSACNKVFSSEMIRSHFLRFNEQMTLYEDLDFVLRYLFFCREILFLDHAFYHYRIIKSTSQKHSRFGSVDSLVHNIALLTDSSISLESGEVLQTTANLCAQLFDLHLMEVQTSRKQIVNSSAKMLNCRALCDLRALGIVPSLNASPSWKMIVNGQNTVLCIALKKRKIIRNLKHVLKPIIKKVRMFSRRNT